MIIRSVHDAEHRFFLIRRATAQDRNLTSKARGVLTFLLSKPDGWEVNISNLQKEFPDIGRDAAYAVIAELIENGYAKREQERDKAGKLGQIRIDIYEMPLTEKPYTAEPLPAEPYTEKPEHIDKQSAKRNRAEKETEQQQQRQTAAAAASQFSFDEIKAYVKATKSHAANPGGLAVFLQKSGEEDTDIAEWKRREEFKQVAQLNQTPFDGWTRQQAEIKAREEEHQWLKSLGKEEYQEFFNEAADQFARQFPQHKRGDWRAIHQTAIEKLIVINYYREEIAA